MIAFCLLSASSAIVLQILHFLGLHSSSPIVQQYFGGFQRLGWTATWLVVAFVLSVAAMLRFKLRQALWISAALFGLMGVDVLQGLLARHFAQLGINIGVSGVVFSMFGMLVELVGSIVILAYVGGLFSRDQLS